MAWMITSEDSAEGPALRADSDLMAAHWAYELSIKERSWPQAACEATTASPPWAAY